MKNLIAWVTEKETGEQKLIEREWETKKDFTYTLRSNGYTVHYVTTPENFDKDSDNYHEKKESRRLVQNAVRKIRREIKAEMEGN